MYRSKKLALFFLILILAIPLFNKALQFVKQSVWDGESHINIAIDNGDIEVWSLEPSEKSARIVVIPKNVYLSVGSYGAYRAAAIGKLSLLEKKDGSLVVLAIKESLAIPIDAVLVRKEAVEDRLDPTAYFGLAGLFKSISHAPLSGRVTNLATYDLFRLWALGLKKESIETLNLADTNVVAHLTLPDGGDELVLNREQFSQLAAKHFTDKKIEEEDLTIEVVNATETIGLANTVALLLTNIGGNVINTTKGERADKTVVFTQKESYTAKKVASVVGGTLIDGQPPHESRADIVVILGGESE